MGGKQSTISEEDLTQVQSTHPQFKRVRVVSSAEGKTLQAQFAVGDAKELEEWQQEYPRLQAEESLFLPIEHSLQRRFGCGSSGICTVSYPHYQYLLSDYIARCTTEDTLYEKEKLWYLTYQVTAAASVFHTRGQKVGDLRPRNIFLNGSEGAKVGNRFSWPHQTTNYAKAIFEKEPAFLAPEEIKELSFGHNEPETDFEKAESFSAGLTLLDRAVLSDSSDLYNVNTCRFDYQRLEQRLAKLWELAHLDGLLKQVIEGLCRPDPALRLTCRQVYAWLKRYSHEILTRNEVHFAELPPFLAQPQVTAPLPTYPIPKNMYVESQVVSEFTGRFATQQPTQQPEPLRELPARQVISTCVVPPPPLPLQTALPIDPVSEDFSTTLRKIEQQLQRSRRMFPS